MVGSICPTPYKSVLVGRCSICDSFVYKNSGVNEGCPTCDGCGAIDKSSLPVIEMIPIPIVDSIPHPITSEELLEQYKRMNDTNDIY